MDKIETGSVAAETAATDAPEVVETEIATDEAAITEDTKESDNLEVDDESTDSTDSPDSLDSDDSKDSEDDVFEGLLPSFLSTEEIDAKYKRVPKDAVNEIKRLTDIAQKNSTTVEEMGGDFGIKTFKPFASIITKDSATEDEIGEAVLSIVHANPTIGRQMVEAVTLSIMSASSTADPVLQTIFGEDVSFDKINELLKFDRSGLFAEATDNFKENYQYTDLYDKQQVENKRLSSEVAELKEAIKNPEKVKEYQSDTRSVASIKEFDNSFTASTREVLLPVFDRVKWPHNSELAKMVTSVVQNSLREDERYKNTTAYLKKNPGQKELADTNVVLLRNKATAISIKLIQAVQQDLRKISENGRNATLVKEQIAEVKEVAKPIELPTDETLTPAQKQAILDEQYRATIASRRFTAAASSKV